MQHVSVLSTAIDGTFHESRTVDDDLSAINIDLVIKGKKMLLFKPGFLEVSLLLATIAVTAFVNIWYPTTFLPYIKLPGSIPECSQ